MDYAIADAIINFGDKLINAIKYSAREVGKEGVSGMGAIEFLAVETHTGLTEVADALNRIANKMDK